MGFDEAVRKYKIGRASLKRWIDRAKELSGQQDVPTREIRTVNKREELNSLLFEFLSASIKMGLAIANTCSNPEFIQSKPGDVRELAEVVFDRADRLVQFASAAGAEPEPE